MISLRPKFVLFRGKTLALLLGLLACGLSFPNSSDATVIATTEGEVTVMGGDEPNKFTIKEAKVHITDETVGDVYLSFVAPWLIPYRTLDAQVQALLTKIGEPPATGTPSQPTSGSQWKGSLAAMIALILLTNPNSQETLETDRAILIEEHNKSTQPPQPIWPCHWVRFESSVDQYQVLCPMLNQNASVRPPNLRVAGQGGNDVIDLDLETESWFLERNIYGGNGSDSIKGSKFIDWVRTHSDDGAADVIDCGDPNPLAEAPGNNGDFGSATNAGDMIDPGWEDFESMRNCEDVALPPLPEELANSGGT